MGQARVGLIGKGKASAASHNLPLQAVNRLVFPNVVEFHASLRLHWESGTVLSKQTGSGILRPGRAGTGQGRLFSL